MTRIQISGALLALLMSVVAVAFSVGWSADAPFLLRRGEAEWITTPAPVFPATHVVLPDTQPTALFRRSFRAGRPMDAELRVRSLGTLEVELNGARLPLPASERACLKRVCRAGTEGSLRLGDNTLEVQVRNPVGPPVLWLELVGNDLLVATDSSWTVSSGSGPAERPARADDTRPYDDATAGESSLQLLRSRATTILSLFCVSLLGFLGGRRWLSERSLTRLPEAALLAVSVFWIFLFLVKFDDVPTESGYDARFHVQYVRHVAEHGALPEPMGGPAMYHPPLFHALAAAAIALFEPSRDGRAERQLLGLLPFLSGLGMVWICWAVSRRIFADEPRSAAFAIALAGFLPLNLYMSAYVSNEPLHAALASGALWVLVGALLGGAPTARRLAVLALLLGLACLTKYTALGILAVFVSFLALKRVVADRAAPMRAAAAVAAVVLGAAAVSGWIYLRNWIDYGDPLVWNLDLPGGGTWWQPPGFRTADYYLGFGESLQHPYFSGFHSFWDGIYATLWGEGLPPTAYTLQERHGVWDYDWMSIGYLLAIPATLLLALGFVRALRAALRGDDLRRRIVWTLFVALLALFGLGLLQVSIRYPIWGGVRASYTLSALVPLALVGALGFSWLDRWLAERGWTAARAIFYGWSGALVGVIVLSFAG